LNDHTEYNIFYILAPKSWQFILIINGPIHKAKNILVNNSSVSVWDPIVTVDAIANDIIKGPHKSPA
jgi:hypothetical protein